MAGEQRRPGPGWAAIAVLACLQAATMLALAFTATDRFYGPRLGGDAIDGMAPSTTRHSRRLQHAQARAGLG